LAVIGGVVYIVLLCFSAVQRYVEQVFTVDVEDNYMARRLHTQVTVLKRVLSTVVIVVAVALALMTVPSVRNLGASLLASAGFAGLVIGLAARPMLENLIAGVQLALTQPISIDDVVIVEGEWGWVEQINTTYVVIRTWDERRLIVPFSKFLQETFQNWTRRTARILGSVFLHVDYTFPVQALRDELERVVKACDKWDGRVCVLQVTDATAQTIELRALVSARNSPVCWDLRVHVREKLIEFLQREHPECLPRTRMEVSEPHPALDCRDTSGKSHP
jgi:small-conductance mechanosensitive channel